MLVSLPGYGVRGPDVFAPFLTLVIHLFFFLLFLGIYDCLSLSVHIVNALNTVCFYLRGRWSYIWKVCRACMLEAITGLDRTSPPDNLHM